MNIPGDQVPLKIQIFLSLSLTLEVLVLREIYEFPVSPDSYAHGHGSASELDLDGERLLFDKRVPTTDSQCKDSVLGAWLEHPNIEKVSVGQTRAFLQAISLPLLNMD